MRNWRLAKWLEYVWFSSRVRYGVGIGIRFNAKNNVFTRHMYVRYVVDVPFDKLPENAKQRV